MRAVLFFFGWFSCVTTYGASPIIEPTKPELTEAQIICSLIEGLDDSDVEVRINLAAALSVYGSKAVPKLIEALENGSPSKRAGAAYALSQLRGYAKPALPTLLKALKDKDDGVRRQASYAISRIVSVREPSMATSAPDPTPAIVVPPLDPVPGTNSLGGNP